MRISTTLESWNWRQSFPNRKRQKRSDHIARFTVSFYRNPIKALIQKNRAVFHTGLSLVWSEREIIVHYSWTWWVPLHFLCCLEHWLCASSEMKATCLQNEIQYVWAECQYARLAQQQTLWLKVELSLTPLRRHTGGHIDRRSTLS